MSEQPKWTAVERPDESVYLTTGDYECGKFHCAFDVECDFEMAQKFADAMNRISELEAQVATLEAEIEAVRVREAARADLVIRACSSGTASQRRRL